MTAIPASLKNFVSAIKRAEELERDSNPATQRNSHVVAYYCRLYVASKVTPTNPEETAFLTEQISILEKLKPTLGLAPGPVGQDEGKTICLSHADSLFFKADEIDRNGWADKATVKLFYAAGTFYDILEQFGPLDQEVYLPIKS